MHHGKVLHDHRERFPMNIEQVMECQGQATVSQRVGTVIQLQMQMCFCGYTGISDFSENLPGFNCVTAFYCNASGMKMAVKTEGSVIVFDLNTVAFDS